MGKTKRPLKRNKTKQEIDAQFNKLKEKFKKVKGTEKEETVSRIVNKVKKKFKRRVTLGVETEQEDIEQGILRIQALPGGESKETLALVILKQLVGDQLDDPPSFPREITFDDAIKLTERQKNALIVQILTEAKKIPVLQDQLETKEKQFAKFEATPIPKGLDINEKETVSKLAEALFGIKSGNKELDSYLGEVRNLLSSEELAELETILNGASIDILREELTIKEFVYVVRGFQDNPTAFKTAIKTKESFTGQHGWVSFLKTFPDMEKSIKTIQKLITDGKIKHSIEEATDSELAYIHAFTASGDFLNQPLRYNLPWFGQFGLNAFVELNEVLDELRKGDRLYLSEVYSGKAYTKGDFDRVFKNGKGKVVEMKGFVSSTTKQSTAEAFVRLTAKWAGTGEKVGVIRRIKPKTGVYIDDLSDWGENLGKTNHPNEPLAIQIQSEVVMKEGKFKQVGDPKPVMDGNKQREVDGMLLFYVDFEELDEPLE